MDGQTTRYSRHRLQVGDDDDKRGHGVSEGRRKGEVLRARADLGQAVGLAQAGERGRKRGCKSARLGPSMAGLGEKASCGTGQKEEEGKIELVSLFLFRNCFSISLK